MILTQWIYLKEWLERKSYMVMHTSRTQEVPGLLENFKPYLVIIDVLQKDVAEAVMVEAQGHQTPVLLMTGYTGRLNNTQLPGTDVIEKPLDLELLVSKIKKLVRNISGNGY